MNEIQIYNTEKGTQIQIRLEKDTVWLSQKQMAELFDRDTDTISLHIKNIYADKELNEVATTEFSSLVQKEGTRLVNRKVKLYNLDVIISVGYRVNSKRGTQFRQWATQRLKEHIIQGYTINQKRLNELQQTVHLIKKSIGEGTSLTEAKGLLDIITQYTQSFVLLNQFDSNSLESDNLNENITYKISPRPR